MKKQAVESIDNIPIDQDNIRDIHEHNEDSLQHELPGAVFQAVDKDRIDGVPQMKPLKTI